MSVANVVSRPEAGGRLPALRPYQIAPARAIAGSALNGRGLSFSVVMARQAGKNELSAQVELLLLARAAGRAADGVKCAPTFEPQCRISMQRLWTRLHQAGLGAGVRREEGRAVRMGGARIVFLSAEPAAHVVGHTAGLILEVDEAQDVDRDKFDREFRPMAAPFGSTVVYYGTPWDESTLLEQAVAHHLELERRDGVQRHFAADWTVAAEGNPAYARYVEAERQRLGEDHPLFRTQYALKPVAGSGRLFAGSQLAQLQGAHPRRHARADGEVYVAGLDLGGQAGPAGVNDETVLTVARVVPAASDAIVQAPRLEVVEHLAFCGVPHDELLARLIDVLRSLWGVRRVAVDATGLGETIARLLARALGEDVVEAFKFSAASKSALGFSLVAAVNSGRLKVYAADGSAEYAAFRRQVERARVGYRPGGQMTFYVDPAEGRDDYLMSLALIARAGGDMPDRPRIARGRISTAWRVN